MASGGSPPVSRRPCGTELRPRGHVGTARGHTPPRRRSGQLPALRCDPPQPGSKRFARSSQPKRWLHFPNSTVHCRCFRSSPTPRTKSRIICICKHNSPAPGLRPDPSNKETGGDGRSTVRVAGAGGRRPAVKPHTFIGTHALMTA